MSRKRAIILNILLLIGVGGYLTAAGILWQKNHSQITCQEVQITLHRQTPYHILTDSTITAHLAADTILTLGEQIDQIDHHRIETSLYREPYIESVESYSTLQGQLLITVRQATPILRIKGENGYDFYIDSSYQILPPRAHCPVKVPIVSGHPRLNFPKKHIGPIEDKKYEKDREYLKKITNFVGKVSQDELLRELIVQIYINPQGEIELIPRIGSQIILFGDLDDQAEKLTKLKIFYRNAFSTGWWRETKKINLKYRTQVVVS